MAMNHKPKPNTDQALIDAFLKKGGEIKNLELIKEIYSLHQTLKDKVQVLHVNGHVGVQGNELADRMSILAIQSRETSQGSCRSRESRRP